MKSVNARPSETEGANQGRVASPAELIGRPKTSVSDVIVMGAGSLGLWTAALLILAGYKVRVLEANHAIGLSSTSLNASLGSRMFVCNRAVWALTHVGMKMLENPPPGIFGQAIVTPIDVTYLAQIANVEARMAELLKLAIQSQAEFHIHTAEKLAADMPFVPTSERAGGISERGLRLNVPAMLEAFQQFIGGPDGSGIVTDAFTHTVERTASGTWRLDTLAGRFEAPIVIDATGTRGDVTGRLFGGARIDLKATKRHRFIAKVDHPERLTRKGQFVFSDGGPYWVREEDDTVLFSPADETPCTAQDNDLEAAIVREAIKGFERLNPVKVRAYRRVTAGHRPFVDGRVPIASIDHGAPGLYRLLGPSGYGMQGGAALALIMVALVTGAPMPAELLELGMTFETFALLRTLAGSEANL
jgi:D-arginine dehydrogenase